MSAELSLAKILAVKKVMDANCVLRERIVIYPPWFVRYLEKMKKKKPKKPKY